MADLIDRLLKVNKPGIKMSNVEVRREVQLKVRSHFLYIIEAVETLEQLGHLLDSPYVEFKGGINHRATSGEIRGLGQSEITYDDRGEPLCARVGSFIKERKDESE